MQNSVSFGSNIKFTTPSGFTSEIIHFPFARYVDEPWTAKEIVRAPYAYTTGVKTCTSGGILVGSEKTSLSDVVMFHIDPDNVDNSHFKKIEETIWDKIGDDNPIQGFLLGSKKHWKQSTELFNMFEEFMAKLRIPCSKLRGIPTGKGDFANIAYNASEDYWVVCSSAIPNVNEKEIVRNFDEVVLSPKDKLVLEQDK